MRQGEVVAVIGELERQAKAAAEEERGEALRVRTAHFRTHRERMRYPEFEQMGLPISSGAIEGTCKNLIKGRMDGVGMRWDVEAVIKLMTALRVGMFNARWEELWDEEPRQAA